MAALPKFEDIAIGQKIPKVGKIYAVLCDAFPLVAITSKEHNRAALKVMERLIDILNEHPNKAYNNDVSQYVGSLATLISDFESKTYKFDKPTGVELLQFLMEQNSLTQRDLKAELGGQSIVSVILRGDRELNVRQIRALAKRFNISPAAFIG